MHLTRLSFLCFPVFTAAGLTAQEACPRGTLPAYAHNDYVNKRPLYDALSLGYKGVEADVFLVDGELRLGHDRREARRGATLEARYLAPLRSLVARCGALTTDGRPFLFNVELKEESRPAFDTLVALLARYAELFTPDSQQATAPGYRPPAIQVVLVGWSPRSVADRTPVPLGTQARLRRPDARAVDAMDPAVGLISVDYRKTMGRWWLTRGRRRRWLSTVQEIKAAFPATRIRAYDAPVNERVYRNLLTAGVDLIGTMKLAPTARLLNSIVGPVKGP